MDRVASLYPSSAAALQAEQRKARADRPPLGPSITTAGTGSQTGGRGSIAPGVSSEILTARLVIRPVRDSDLPDLLEANRDEVTTRFVPYPTWTSLADGEAWLGRMRALESAGTGETFALELRGSGKVIGFILLFRIDGKSRRAELGYLLGRAYWGQGYMHEALEAFVRQCFTARQLRRLEAEVDPRNLASARSLTRLGFTQEGLLRQRWIGKDGPYDSAIFGLLSGDPGVSGPASPAAKPDAV